ncbi:YwqG family protein [Aestuariibius sp. 2305UL40-4]|uniref:YwqG family protein n=1 Tax=Aestuariibius violaceus TaxID=3234132 RepID=UPI00345EE4AD
MGNLAQWIMLAATLAVVAFFLVRERRKEKESGYFSGRKPEASGKPPDDRDWPGIMERARREAEALARPAIALTLTDQPSSEDPHSSVGGRPSLPPGAPWPLDSGGTPMIFLAQINFGEMPPLEGYPAEGVLSFFVRDNDLNGCRFPSVGNDGFALLYHESAGGLERRDLPEEGWEFSPLSPRLTQEGRRLTGRPAMGPVSPNSLGLVHLSDIAFSDAPDDLHEAFYDGLAQAKEAQVYYGGHPDFTQDDFRRIDDRPSYSEVLLQLGFVYDEAEEIEICWGDAGEACFLISKEDLAARRFDRVAYNWDCS